jgi:hypothetical protein
MPSNLNYFYLIMEGDQIFSFPYQSFTFYSKSHFQAAEHHDNLMKLPTVVHILLFWVENKVLFTFKDQYGNWYPSSFFIFSEEFMHSIATQWDKRRGLCMSECVQT